MFQSVHCVAHEVCILCMGSFRCSEQTATHCVCSEVRLEFLKYCRKNWVHEITSTVYPNTINIYEIVLNHSQRCNRGLCPPGIWHSFNSQSKPDVPMEIGLFHLQESIGLRRIPRYIYPCIWGYHVLPKSRNSSNLLHSLYSITKNKPSCAKYIRPALSLKVLNFSLFFFSCGTTAHVGPRPSHCWDFQTTVRQTQNRYDSPLYERSASRRNRYLQNKHKTRKSMPSEGFEPTIPGVKMLQTYALDCADTWIVSV
jgi:hypothetical protein